MSASEPKPPMDESRSVVVTVRRMCNLKIDRIVERSIFSYYLSVDMNGTTEKSHWHRWNKNGIAYEQTFIFSNVQPNSLLGITLNRADFRICKLETEILTALQRHRKEDGSIECPLNMEAGPPYSGSPNLSLSIEIHPDIVPALKAYFSGRKGLKKNSLVDEADRWVILLEKFVQVGDILETVAEVHPYSQLAIRVFFAGFKLWRQQRQVNLKIQDFLVSLSDVADFFIKLDQNKLDELQRKVVAQILEQVNECGFFLYENLKEEKSFFRTVTGLVLNSMDDAITEYEKAFQHLQDSFQQGTQVNIQMKMMDMSQSLQDIRTDVNFNDMLYAKGVRFQSSKQCAPNSRETILDCLIKWILDGEESRLCILIESGDIPKSAVSHSIAKRFEDVNGLGSSFCFDKETHSNIRIEQIFPTIAVDLARHDSSIRKRLGDIVHDPSIRSIIDLQDQFDYFISRTVVHASRKAPVVIVLDGLDECGDEASRARFFRILCHNESLQTFPQNFRILLTLSSESWAALNLRQSRHIKVMDRIVPDSAQPASDAWASIPSPRPSISGTSVGGVSNHPTAQQPPKILHAHEKFPLKWVLPTLKMMSEIVPLPFVFPLVLLLNQHELLLGQSESLILGLFEDTRNAMELLLHTKELELSPGQEKICLHIAQVVKESGNLLDLLNRKSTVYKILRSQELTQKIPDYQKQLQELQTAFHIQTSVGIQLAVQKFSRDAARRYEDSSLNLLPSFPGQRFYGSRGYEHRNLPQDVIDQFMERILGPGEARIFLLIGPPGTGKSAAVQSVAQRLADLGQLVSSFVFDSSAQTPVEIYKVFPTIAKDLARFDSGLKTKLVDIIRDHSIRDATNLQDQFDHLIVTTAAHLFRNDSIFIILDGLDEYNNAEATGNYLFDVLCNEASLRKLPSNIKIVITTIPDSHIAITGRNSQDALVMQLSATGLSVESTATFKPEETSPNPEKKQRSEEGIPKVSDHLDNNFIRETLDTMPKRNSVFLQNFLLSIPFNSQARDLTIDMTNALEFVKEISAGNLNDAEQRISESIVRLADECFHFLSDYIKIPMIKKFLIKDQLKEAVVQYQQRLHMLQSALHREIAVHTSYIVQQISQDLTDQTFLYKEETPKTD